MRRSVRTDRADGTRDAILTAAERLFAEHGVFAVSNRQVSEAAGQGNNAAVGYHFGTKADLIRAIVRKHNEQVERLCQQMVDRLLDSADSASLRDWVDCLVRPLATHLDRTRQPDLVRAVLGAADARPERTAIWSRRSRWPRRRCCTSSRG